MRKTGAIALEMAWTAAGFYDGLLAGFGGAIQLYDVAAGMLLLTEAGGQMSDFQGGVYRPEGRALVASNGVVHAELIAFLNRNRSQSQRRCVLRPAGRRVRDGAGHHPRPAAQRR